MRRAEYGVGLLAMATAMLASGCLELNPSYVDDDQTDGTDAATDAASDESTAAQPVECELDAYDPNSYEEPADATALQLSDLRLEGEGDEDHYKAWVDPGGPAEVFARTPDVDLRVCFFAECEGGGSATITKCAGVASTSPVFLDGCCEIGAVGLEYTCPSGTGVDAHVRIDGGDACTDYELEIGSN